MAHSMIGLSTKARTLARIANMRRIIAALGTRDLSRADIPHILGMSSSGSRSYIQAMLDFGVAEVATRAATGGPHGMPIYRLLADAEQIECFIAQLGMHGERGSIPALPAPEPGRHFHILADDVRTAVRVHAGPAVRDWLQSAFFGPAHGREARV